MLNASAMSTAKFMHQMFCLMKFVEANQIGCEQALKMWQVILTGSGDPRADVSETFTLGQFQ